MAALAEILTAKGSVLSGSDVPDTFYTDAILRSIGMKVNQSFDADNIDASVDAVIYSDAYNPSSNPELIEALKKGIPTFSFAQALGALSRLSDSSGISGVHGKTTTTAMTGSILKAMDCPVTVLTGSAVSSFGDRCTIILGDKYFVAETDEYRRHFMHFSPRRILLTSVESDHQDFYPTYDSILQAFKDYGLSLAKGGSLVYCADNPGAIEVAVFLATKRPDIKLVPYGFNAEGQWKVQSCVIQEGASVFRLNAWAGDFSLHVPGRHLVADAVGALAMAYDIMLDFSGGDTLSNTQWNQARDALAAFKGSRRRSEIIGSAGGVLIMDDYAHHPTALKTTIAGIKAFWPARRIVVDFMSHTFSRTIALMDDFAASLDDADCVVLHDIYPSAREAPVAGVSGRNLFEKVKARRGDLIDLSGKTEIPPVAMRPGFI
ncbi:MAG TPA: UDP-N-acetylmuramate--L-alanine ligase, partial [Rectinemataceae bacterium]|nr:UDP-N-acetylmuramate--L-alanine ligase [Rectinemataceae bacterium]